MNYTIDFETIVRDERQLKAIIWLNIEEFTFLSEMFKEMRDTVRLEKYIERQQKGKINIKTYGWKKGRLNTPNKKLFFVLYYLKTYPTFDNLWFMFWLARSTCCEQIHILVPILQRTFEELWVSPKREIKDPRDWEEAFGKNIEELIVDATERKHFRHKDNEEQKKHYSGKKKFIPQKIL